MENIKVGDIFLYSWGYEQTNVEVYQVVKRTEKMVQIREIATEVVKSVTSMSSKVLPVKDKFIGEVIRKKIIDKGSSIFIKMDIGNAYQWNGEEIFESSYY